MQLALSNEPAQGVQNYVTFRSVDLCLDCSAGFCVNAEGESGLRVSLFLHQLCVRIARVAHASG